MTQLASPCIQYAYFGGVLNRGFAEDSQLDSVWHMTTCNIIATA